MSAETSNDQTSNKHKNPTMRRAIIFADIAFLLLVVFVIIVALPRGGKIEKKDTVIKIPLPKPRLVKCNCYIHIDKNENTGYDNYFVHLYMGQNKKEMRRYKNYEKVKDKLNLFKKRMIDSRSGCGVRIAILASSDVRYETVMKLYSFCRKDLGLGAQKIYLSCCERNELNSKVREK
jgi:hypothetical protein